MAAIKGKDTRPEMALRSMLDAMRIRYEVHRSDLKGEPGNDLPHRKKIIFVHGCFWHLHRCRYGRVKPAVNAQFWRDKRKNTRLRDKKNRAALRRDGWRLLMVWECWKKNPDSLPERLSNFLDA